MFFFLNILGSIGQVERDEVDISINSRIVFDYNTTNCLFLFPIFSTKLQFLVPKAINRLYIIKSLLSLFEPSVVYLMSMIIFLLPPVYSLVTYYEHIWIFKTKKKINFESLTKPYIHLLGVLFFVSQRLPRTPTMRIVTASVFFFALIFGNVIQGSIIRILNSNQNSDRIRTLDQLFESSLKIKFPSAVRF